TRSSLERVGIDRRLDAAACAGRRRFPSTQTLDLSTGRPRAESREPKAESREPRAELSDSPKLPGSLPVLEEAAAALAIERVPLLAMPIADAADVALEISQRRVAARTDNSRRHRRRGRRLVAAE